MPNPAYAREPPAYGWRSLPMLLFKVYRRVWVGTRMVNSSRWVLSGLCPPVRGPQPGESYNRWVGGCIWLSQSGAGGGSTFQWCGVTHSGENCRKVRISPRVFVKAVKPRSSSRAIRMLAGLATTSSMSGGCPFLGRWSRNGLMQVGIVWRMGVLLVLCAELPPQLGRIGSSDSAALMRCATGWCREVAVGYGLPQGRVNGAGAYTGVAINSRTDYFVQPKATVIYQSAGSFVYPLPNSRSK